MNSQTDTWFQFALQQVAAESYLDGIDWAIPEQVRARLFQGNTNPAFPATGYTRAPDDLGKIFSDRYTIIAHRANDATGFSGTLLRWTNDEGGTEYTLSIRSTEYKNANQGGDWQRDGLPGGDGEIVRNGFALGQLAALEDFYQRVVLPLTGAAKLNVTGYSLGGHLATVFTETHAAQVEAAYVFNSAGRGEITGPGGTTAQRMSAMIDHFRAVLTSEPSASALAVLSPNDPRRPVYQGLYQAARQAYLADPAWDPFVASDANIYADPRYRWALVETRELAGYGTKSVAIGRAGLGTAGDALITSIYGSALNADSTLVANSQVHPSNKNAVFIEGQPFLELALSSQQQSDFGNTHAITLLADSLALQREFQRFDATLTREQIEAVINASSAKKAKVLATLGDAQAAEGDSLEKTLLALRRAFDAVVRLGFITEPVAMMQPQ
jgi:pimeloyl-ACP methyl ester carboxylesterase